MSATRNRLVGTVLGAALMATTAVAFAAPALADTSPTSTVTVPGKTLAAIQADGAAAIAQREAQLTKIGAELAEAPSCDANGVIAAEITADGPALTALGQKLAADTTIADAKTDFGSIFTTYRVYLVVTPQAYVTAACGHVQHAATRLSTDEQKLATKVAALPDGAVKTAAQASLADLATELTNGTSQANAAATALATIGPDKGDKAVQASNAAAVASAHAQLATARADLLTALRDAKAVVADLKSAGV